MTATEQLRIQADVARILICDDHVVFAESLAHLLTSVGHVVVGVTHHPDEAVSVLRRAQPDVCLLDVTFGADSVLYRLADIRNASPCTRVVLLSGQVDDGLVIAGRAAGVRGVANKCQPVDAILAIIDAVTSGNIVMPDAAALAPAAASPSPARSASDIARLAAYLTPREREVLGALVRGFDTTKSARTLTIAVATARCHVQSVLTKLGAHSRLEAATTAVRSGMVDPETGDWLGPVG
jgi:two-component system nitrate/nitrite response regulator NarL